jgi:hypothetical protein
MVSANLVHESALDMAANLAPGGVDRVVFLPVAVLALLSSRGKAGLYHSDTEPGFTFPASRSELPVINEAERDQVAVRVAGFVGDMVAALNIDSRHILGIHGLHAHDKGLSDLLQGRRDGESNRLYAILPFSVALKNQPQLPSISWYTVSEAGRHILSGHSSIPIPSKRLILARLKERHGLLKTPGEDLQNPV